MLNSGLVRVSGNVLLNKSLDVLFFTVAAVVGYGVLLLFEKVLNLRMLNKEYARILIVVLMTLITRLVWIHIVDITPKSDLSCTILGGGILAGRGRRRQVCGSFSPYIWLSLILATVYRIFSPDKYFALLLNICLKQARVLFILSWEDGLKLENRFLCRHYMCFMAFPCVLFFNCLHRAAVYIINGAFDICIF